MKTFLFSLLIPLFFTACQKETAKSETSATSTEVTDRTNGNSAVFPPTAHPYGQSYADWSITWWKEFFQFDCAHNPFNHPENVLFYQSGQVYFLAGLSQTGASVSVTVPHGKAILFPLINFINDYPCPDQTFQPAPGQSLEDFLTQGAQDFLTAVANLSVTVDGNTVSNPTNYGFVSDFFYFTGNPELSGCADACVTGESQPAVAGGFFMMLKPLPTGVHTVHYHAEIPAFNAVQDGTFNITVQ